MSKVKAQKEVSFPQVNYQDQGINTAQDQKVLPRQIFASGTLPGNTVMNIGANNLAIDGKNKKFAVYDSTGTEIIRIGLLADGSWGITVTGGSISGTTISGSTVTGGTIQTSSTGERIVLSGGNETFANSLRFYYSNGNLAINMSNGSITFYDPVNAGVALGSMQTVTGNQAIIFTNNIISYQKILAQGFGIGGGNDGVSGSFVSADSKIVTVESGIITSIV